MDTQSNSSLTARVRLLCQEIVEELAPQETPFFDQVWGTFLNHLGCVDIEEISEVPPWRSAGESNTALGAIGDATGQVWDSLQLIGVVVGAIVNLHQCGRDSLLDTATIDQAIQTEALRLKVSDRIRKTLEPSVVGLLAELFSALDWKEQAPKSEATARGLFAVDWCEHSSHESDRTPVSGETFTRIQVDERIRPMASGVSLFVDEMERKLSVRGQLDRNRWDELQSRHLGFLYLVLRNLRNKKVLHHEEFLDPALGDLNADPAAIRRTKYELNSLLDGVLNEFVKAKRRMRRYELGPVSYCWIRYADSRSLLLA